MNLRKALLMSNLVITALATAADKDARVFELRTYSAHPGKLDGLNARFRDHTVKLFEKHGITNIGYWTPIDNIERKLVYVVAFPSVEARQKSFAAFGADPAWQKARSESEANGPLVAKIESQLMRVTPFSPELKPLTAGERVYELRTYTAAPNCLEQLNARFADHTIKLFEKHGMANLVYWNLLKEQKDADKMLLYLLAHKSVEAARASFGAFRQDSAWLAARKASEDKAGGSLTVADGGVKSVFMKATDYSAIK